MIKTLLFDNNGVFTTNDAGGTYKKLAKFFGVSEGELKPKQDFIALDLDEGKITTNQFYKFIQEQLGTKKDYHKLRNTHLSSYEIRDEVKNYVKTLKNKYELAMLTNFGDGFDEANKKYWKLEEIFEPSKIFVSCKVGMRKPNIDFYEFAINKLNKKPGEIIFIDDRKENVETAEKIGMKGIVFQNFNQFKKDLDRLILEDKVE